MTVVARDLYAEAEERLGRKLTRAERAIDLDADVATLEEAKADLADAIEQEKRRAIRRFIGGGGSELRVTPAMLAILVRLREAGRRAAIAEIERLDATPVRSFSAVEDRLSTDPALAPLLGRLREGLRGVSKRVADEGYTQIIGGDVGGSALARAIDRRVPGALDVASRMVSSPFYAGMGDVFSANVGLFGAWQYSAVMDRGTCGVCAGHDGEVYDSWEEATIVLPNGGPNPYCYGGGRCRCRLAPYLRDTPVPTPIVGPVSAPLEIASEPRSAAQRMMDAFRAKLVREGRVVDEIEHAKGVDNWEKMIAAALDTDADVVAKLATVDEHNRRSGLYVAALDRFGADHVIPIRADAPKGTLLRGGDHFAASRKTGNMTTVITREAVDLPATGPLSPGMAATSSSVAPILRHEYAHSVWDVWMSPAQKAEFRSILAKADDVKDEMTFYASTRDDEAFCEVFAVVTDPDYDETIWRGWVREARSFVKGLTVPD